MPVTTVAVTGRGFFSSRLNPLIQSIGSDAYCIEQKNHLDIVLFPFAKLNSSVNVDRKQTLSTSPFMDGQVSFQSRGVCASRADASAQGMELKHPEGTFASFRTTNAFTVSFNMLFAFSPFFLTWTQFGIS